jgi:hypothetical protein
MVSQTLLVALATIMQPAAPAQAWKPYAPPQGNYTVSLPAKPTEKKQTLTLPGGGKVDMTVVSVKRGGTYSVVSGELKATPDDPAAALDAARDDLVKGLKGKLVEEKPCELGGAPARELKIEIPKTVVAGGAMGWARISLMDRKLYELIAVQSATEAKNGAAPVETFFDSFKTSDKPSAAPKVAAKDSKPEVETKGAAEPKAAAKPAGAGPDDAARPGWEKFTSAGGGYTVLMPGKPNEVPQKVNAPPLGEVEIHVAAVNKGLSIAFVVIYNDFPPGQVPMGNIEMIYDGSRQGALATSGGTLAGEKKLMLGDLPGREIKIELPATKVPGGAMMQIRYFLKGARLYQVMYIAPKADVNADEAEAFFDSFRITPK